MRGKVLLKTGAGIAYCGMKSISPEWVNVHCDVSSDLAWPYQISGPWGQAFATHSLVRYRQSTPWHIIDSDHCLQRRADWLPGNCEILEERAHNEWLELVSPPSSSSDQKPRPGLLGSRLSRRWPARLMLMNESSLSRDATCGSFVGRGYLGDESIMAPILKNSHVGTTRLILSARCVHGLNLSV